MSPFSSNTNFVIKVHVFIFKNFETEGEVSVMALKLDMSWLFENSCLIEES